jgi:hypothetical protein
MFNQLPDDCVFEISKFLDSKSLISFSKTSKRNSQFVTSNLIWENLYTKHWKLASTSEKKLSNEPLEDYEEIIIREEIIPLHENYYELYKKRQFDYNNWKRNLV